MTFQQLAYTVEVAKHTSFNKAAEQLYTHQSNVSTAIKQLEKELGIQIFERTKKGVTLTPEGREFISYAQEIVNRKSFVENLYAARNRNRRNILNVSSMRSYFLSVPITGMLEELNSPQSDSSTYVRLEKCSFDDVLENVSTCEADVGAVFVLESQREKLRQQCSVKGLECFSLGKTQVNLVMRDGHPWLKGQTDNPISEYPYMVSEPIESFGRLFDERSSAIDQVFQTSPRCMVSVNDSITMQDIVAQSDSFFISSTSWQHKEHYCFDSRPLDGEGSILEHFYILRKDQAPSPLVVRYLEELQKMFQ